MFPHERSLVQQLSGKPFTLIGVNSDREIEVPQQLVRDGTVTWRSFWNGPEGTGGPISRKWGIKSWPTIYVMDADGVIRYKNVRGDALDAAIETLLAEIGEPVTLEHDLEE